jgi:hypothetical protein
MYYNVHYVFYPQFSHQHILAAFAAIFSEKLLLQKNKFQMLVVSPSLHNN